MSLYCNLLKNNTTSAFKKTKTIEPTLIEIKYFCQTQGFLKNENNRLLFFLKINTYFNSIK